MKIAVGVCVLAALFWSVRVWRDAADGMPVHASTLWIGAFCAGVAAAAVMVWLRRRGRRRLEDMRGSALW